MRWSPSAAGCARSTACGPRRRPARRRSPPTTPTPPARPRCWPRPSGWPTASAGADPAMDALAERLRALRIEAEDLGVELRGYLEGLDADPERLHQIEERLDGYDRLERKHGGSVAAVLEHAERCRAERDRLADAEVATERAVAAAAEAEAERAALAARAHHGAGEGGAEAGRAGGRGARLPVDGRRLVRDRARAARGRRARRAPSGSTSCWPPNPGVPASPLRETASGGELSRVMLALMTAAGAGHGADAGVRRGRLRGGRPDRPRGRGAAAGARRRAPGALHHPPAADRGAGRASLPDREEPRGARWPPPASSSCPARRSSRSCAACSGADSEDDGARKHAEELLAAA